MRNSFWGLIWSSFQEIQGVLIGFLGIVLAIFLPRFPFNTAIPLDLFLIIGFFTLLFISTLLKAVNKVFRQYQEIFDEYQKIKQRIVPKIRVARKDQATNLIRCLLEYSELFAPNMYISFYYTDDDGFESLIGVGFVENIQTDGIIHTLIDQPIPVYKNILDKLANNDIKILKKTLVKPGFPRNFNQP